MLKSLCARHGQLYICISNGFNMGERILAPKCSAKNLALPHQGGDVGFINENIIVCQISLHDMDYIASMGERKGM